MRLLRRLTNLRGVPEARHVAERAVAPYLRDDVHHLNLDHQRTAERVSECERQLQRFVPAFDELQTVVARLEQHMPAVLNAIASSNGTARVLMRETEALRGEVSQCNAGVAAAADDFNARLLTQEGHLRDIWQRFETTSNDLAPHIDTIGYLLRRVETVRAEMLNELRYGAETDAIEYRVIQPEALQRSELRVNLGAGHICLEGYVNVDMRELPGIDVVASADDLPFERGSLTEFFSSHTLEHFPELELRRKLLPYWIGLLRPGGLFRAVVPDLEAMIAAYAKGEINFDALRAVTYGGQEYAADFHYTGFTPDSLSQMLEAAGFSDIEIIAAGRPNGDCLEFEISAKRKST